MFHVEHRTRAPRPDDGEVPSPGDVPRGTSRGGLRRPPLPQGRCRGLLAQRAVLQPQFQQVLVGLAHRRPRGDPEHRHDLVAVQVGPDRVQLLLLLELGDPLLKAVVRPGQRRRLALVAGRAVRPGQLVQPLQQRTGVPHVAPHRGVGPLTAAVTVEAQVQLDQPRDVLHQLVGVLQLEHPRLGELGADHLVVVEGDPAVRFEAPGLRLADVVQQRGQPQHQVRPLGLQVDGLLQHRQGVLVDVLVPEVLVSLQPQCRQLGQHPVRETGLHQQAQPLARVVGHDELVQLVPHPLGRDDVDPLGHRGHRRDHLGGDLEVQLRREAGRTQHPQRVVGEGRLGGAGSAQQPGSEVVQAAVGVDEVVARQPHRHGVHREVPADQVLLDGVAVGHLRLARGPVVRLAAVGGHLDLETADPALGVLGLLHAADGTEGDTDLPHRVRPRPQDLQYLLGARVGGEVQVVAEPAQQGVPYGAADQCEGEPGSAEAVAQLLGYGLDPVVGRPSGSRGLRSLSGIVGIRHNVKGYGSATTARARVSRPCTKEQSAALRHSADR
ncbi:conserved hypothetical protein [Actinacidiphila cocklensis]|uniref:Uncharacterized protein n=1 Tax=Actinacidiphila cocklensis TaxID=887465 RepID=A0A9W4DTY8_9ACTN|nr:conserved hypothetical protein [Actinacidiphila cocklensis]